MADADRQQLPNSMCRVSASGAAPAARISTGADEAAAYAHPISDSAETRRGRWTSPKPSAAATAATTEAISGGQLNTSAAAAPTVAAFASTRPRKMTRLMTR